jgi:hypothetical protein
MLETSSNKRLKTMRTQLDSLRGSIEETYNRERKSRGHPRRITRMQMRPTSHEMFSRF